MKRLIRELATPHGQAQRRFRTLCEEGRVDWGRHSYGTPVVRTFAGDPTRLVVGSFCSIAEGVSFLLGGNHPLDRASMFPLRERMGLPTENDGYPWSKGDIVLGHDVWIGYRAIITSGVVIGNGACVGAGAVVTKDVPAYAVVAGNPGTVVKNRFDSETSGRLDALAWWSWPDDKVLEARRLLSTPMSEDVLCALERL